MTQEDKQLLIKDLCARLPYGVMIKKLGSGYKVFSIQDLAINMVTSFSEPYRPYLRPMSSMTDNENEELKCVIELGLQALEGEEGHNVVSAAPAAFEIDFYNKHHFDYRGLIPMGLALEAPEGMYKEE